MKYFLICAVALTILSCDTKVHVESNGKTIIGEDPLETLENRELTQEFKDYWYSGEAEISSYDLSQARYGEMREGTAVMIFVTESFDKKDQVKADQANDSNRPVLKFNATRDFNTGIYPYHIMSSTFLPLDKKDNAIKVASSIQEWCGQTYMQMNQDGDEYEVMLHSYFQSEGNDDFEIENVMTENQIAAQLRLDPQAMPTGAIKIIPSTEFLRLKHVETKPYDAVAKLSEMEDGYLYSVKFTDLGRTIAFKTEKTSPYRILSWMDRYKDGSTPMVSTGTLKKSIKSAYWGKNANKDAVLRDSLGI